MKLDSNGAARRAAHVGPLNYLPVNITVYTDQLKDIYIHMNLNTFIQSLRQQEMVNFVRNDISNGAARHAALVDSLNFLPTLCTDY